MHPCRSRDRVSYSLFMLLCIIPLLAAMGCTASEPSADGTDAGSSASTAEADSTSSTSEDVAAEADATPIDLPAIGAAWWFEFNDGVWVEPANAEEVLELFPTDYSVLMGVHATTEDSMDLLLVIANEDGEQDFCNRTIVMGGLQLHADHTFKYGPEDFAFPNGITTEDLILEGTFSADMQTLSDLSFSGAVVLSTIPEDLMILPDHIEICEALDELGLTCTACRDGEPDCFRAMKTGINPIATSEVSLETVDLSDCHEQCELSADNEECELN